MSPYTAGELLRNVTYKPNWTLKIQESHGMVSLFIRVMTTDAEYRGPGQAPPMPIMLSKVLDPYVDSAESFYNFVYRAIREVELHELDEWLKVHGMPLHEPHPSATR